MVLSLYPLPFLYEQNSSVDPRRDCCPGGRSVDRLQTLFNGSAYGYAIHGPFNDLILCDDAARYVRDDDGNRHHVACYGQHGGQSKR